MKISKKVWLIIGIAIFVIALVSLVRIYTQQVREQEQLSVSLAAQQTLLRGLTASKNETEKQLAQAESLFNTSQAKFPQSLESIEYGEDLFKIAYGQNLYAMADGCGVELTSLTASQPTDKTGGAVTYSISSFVIEIQGNVNDVLDFINAIRTGDGFQLPWSAEMKNVSIDFGDEGVVATINVDIYGYKG